MQQTIWKYVLIIADEQVIEMPGVAQFLCVQVQGDQPCLWALVDSSQPKQRRLLRTYGTGHPIPTEIGRQTYIGTYQVHGGALVFHVFDGGRA